MSGTKCPVSGTNQLVPDKMSGTLGYLFSGLHDDHDCFEQLTFLLLYSIICLTRGHSEIAYLRPCIQPTGCINASA